MSTTMTFDPSWNLQMQDSQKEGGHARLASGAGSEIQASKVTRAIAPPVSQLVYNVPKECGLSCGDRCPMSDRSIDEPCKTLMYGQGDRTDTGRPKEEKGFP